MREAGNDPLCLGKSVDEDDSSASVDQGWSLPMMLKRRLRASKRKLRMQREMSEKCQMAKFLHR